MPRPLHKQFFSTNRRLWLSVIPEDKRLEFPGAEKSTPASLVTSSVFARRFWNDPHVNLTIAMKKLTPDRAWFGIRSLIKGSKIADDVRANGLKISHFRQLESRKQKHQLSKGATEKYYSDEDLHTLIEIYHKYDKWIRDIHYYDEMDIVRTAHAYLRKPKHSEFKKIKRDKLKQILTNLDMTVESVEFKKDAVAKIGLRKEDIDGNNVSRSFNKKMTQEMVSKLTHFVKRWCEDGIARGYHPRKTVSGVMLYKMRLSKDARMIFSTTVVKNKNAKIVNGEIEYKPILFIYDICFDHDEQRAWYRKNVETITHPNEEDDTPQKTDITMVDHMSQTPGQGPTKTLPKKLKDISGVDDSFIRSAYEQLEDLDQPYNISLDYHQKTAIIDNQPLLIDGLAGTGKTAVLARRGVFRAGFAPDNEGTRILYLASTDAVVQRLVADTSAQLGKDDYWKGRHKKEFLTEFIGIHNEYKNSSSVLQLDDFAKLSEDGFDEIILDECQDITPLEFECLKSFAYSEDPRRFTFAGDPLQTLNPTGFDWARIKAMFTESMYGSEEERNKGASDITITKFHQNYRSQKNVVKFANAIQAHRAILIGNDDDKITMEAMLEPKAEPYLIQVSDPEDEETLVKAITESGLHNVITICWAADDNQLIELCDSTDADRTLNQIWKEKIIDNNEDKYSFRESVILHSSTSIKGDEYESVMLYKFGSSHKGLLNSLKKKQHELDRIRQENLISVSFAYSRLYVAITRPFSNIYIVEDAEGIDFWQNAQLTDNEGNLLNLWSEDKQIYSAKKILSNADFLVKEELVKTNLDKFKNRWNQSKNIIDGESAIRIAKHLNKMDEVHEIEGDIIKIKSEDPSITANDRIDLLKKAIARYDLARRPRKYWPLMFELQQWDKLLPDLYGIKGKPFERIMTLFCRLKLTDISIPSAPDIRVIFNDLNEIKPTNCEWNDWDNSSMIAKFKKDFKKIYLDLFIQNTNKLSQIFDQDIIREFGFEEIRSRLEKWVDKYPQIYLKLTNNFADENYRTNHDKFYAKALMSEYEDVHDLEERRKWVTQNIEMVDQVSKEILSDSQFEDLSKLIDALPKSNNSYDLEKNGYPTFTLRFDSNQNTDELNHTEKLFFYLRESLKYSSPDKFKPKYGGGLLLLLELDLTETYGWAGRFEKIIQSFHRIICDNETLSRKEQTSWINLEFVASIFKKLLLEKGYQGSRKSIADEVKDVIWNGGNSNGYDITKYILEMIIELNKYPFLQKAQWLKLFDPNLMSYQELTPNVIEMIENHNNYFETCMNNKIGGDTYLKIVELYSLYILHHFHNKTTNLESVMLLTITRKKFWNEDYQKLAKLIDFHHTKEGKNLLALLEKDNPIDIKTLQPYIDKLRIANMDILASRYESRLKLTMETIRSQLDSTTSIEQWAEQYNKISDKLVENKLKLTQEDIISLLSKEKGEEVYQLNQVLVDAWKSTSKGSDGLDQLCKLTRKLPVESVLNIFMIAGRASCFLAILNHKEFEKISDEYRGQVEDDLISKLRTEKVSTESKRKSTGSIKSGRQEKSREHNLKIYARLGQINELEMKLMDLDDILVCSIAYYLAKKGTNDITEYKKSFGITSGSGSKAKHIEAILKHFNIEIDESVKEIIRLFSK